MNILFITLLDICSSDERNLYMDLMREFSSHGHQVYVISPAERRTGIPTGFIKEKNSKAQDSIHILKIKTGNIQKTNIVEKGISTVLLEYSLEYGIKTYLKDISFDLLLYSTPPVTLIRPIRFVKSRDGAQTYLMLKDIFPQNAVDLGMMRTTGIKGLLYQYFRKKEKKLYALSDRIGCMSQANVNYVLEHNPDVDPGIVEVCPNCIEIRDMKITAEERSTIREKYGIPQDKKVFVYGGNLGKPQGVPFIIECLKTQEQKDEVYFLIVGDGTEFEQFENYFSEVNPRNMKLMKRISTEDYDRMISACDVGLIFLDHRFTIPNFPSRLLAYMQAGLPVLACTDRNTDIGRIITEGGFGWWCESDRSQKFSELIEETIRCDHDAMRSRGYTYLLENYSAETAYQIIMKQKKSDDFQ